MLRYSGFHQRRCIGSSRVAAAVEQHCMEGEARLFARFRRPWSTRSRFEEIVDRLALPEDWSVEEFFASLERVRGRRIIRRPLPANLPVGLCGLWLARPDDDVVLHRLSEDPTQERHVIGHEAAHMLLGHGHRASPAQLSRMLMGVNLDGGVDASMVRTARGVNSYATRDEYEAEMLATLIMTGARRDGMVRRDRMLRAF
ncbi:hypothetical protein [Nocardia amamiensis]|uniref:hypothetical protein n=1 Tax=Nocardia amamiensis TaxID=404578 RepID=UPI0012F4B65B|nr:hypothetical protein [Nocardia amamiensis]